MSERMKLAAAGSVMLVVLSVGEWVELLRAAGLVAGEGVGGSPVAIALLACVVVDAVPARVLNGWSRYSFLDRVSPLMASVPAGPFTRSPQISAMRQHVLGGHESLVTFIKELTTRCLVCTSLDDLFSPGIAAAELVDTAWQTPLESWEIEHTPTSARHPSGLIAPRDKRPCDPSPARST